jgi:hypothetical protein
LGVAPEHAVAQAPQLSGSLLVFTHAAPQFDCPGGQAVTHAPETQVWPATQAVVHEPQWAGSWARLAQAPEQSTAVPGQAATHWPLLQLGVAPEQAVLHAPQLSGSERVSTQVLPQSVSCAAHGEPVEPPVLPAPPVVVEAAPPVVAPAPVVAVVAPLEPVPLPALVGEVLLQAASTASSASDEARRKRMDSSREARPRLERRTRERARGNATLPAAT